MKAFSILSGKTGCEWVRIILPFYHLVKNGVEARYIFEADRFKIAHAWPKYEVLVLSRRTPMDGQLDALLDMIRIEQARGVRVMYDIDDDPFSERFYSGPEDLTKIFGTVDVVIASTRTLAKRIAPHAKKVSVFENYISMELWDAHKPSRNGLTIGISGSPTHDKDWILAAQAMARIKREHPDVHFIASGSAPEYFQEIPALEIVDAVPYVEYPAVLKRFDIGLAPLASDCEFNLYKSPLKAIDYAGAGAAPLVSDHPVYRQVDCARRVKDDEWYDALKFYVTHPADLAKLRARAEKWVRRNRSLEVGWHHLSRILHQVETAK